MKKNGFMIYELVISFVLAFAILLVIFNTTLTLGQKLSHLYAKNKMTSKQIILNKKIGTDFMNMDIKSLSNCTSSPCTIVYKQNDTTEISKTLTKGKDSNGIPYIEYGAVDNLERITFDKEVEIDNPISSIQTGAGWTLYQIKIPIYYRNDPTDYGIDLFELVYD